ncbi:hypothetical protein [Bradyrhizobium sp. USDA 4520]
MRLWCLHQLLQVDQLNATVDLGSFPQGARKTLASEENKVSRERLFRISGLCNGLLEVLPDGLAGHRIFSLAIAEDRGFNEEPASDVDLEITPPDSVDFEGRDAETLRA